MRLHTGSPSWLISAKQDGTVYYVFCKMSPRFVFREIILLGGTNVKGVAIAVQTINSAKNSYTKQRKKKVF